MSSIPIVSASEILKISEPDLHSKICYHDADYGRHIGFKRISAHHVVIPPGFRSSYPHAESHEEEFFCILKGQASVWLNGELFDMGPGWALGFPSGTGVGHCVINNSSEDLEIFVAGEKTKSGNLCAFPINPELKSDSPIWWEDSPKHELGPHKGWPGPTEFSKKTPPHSVYLPSLTNFRKFHYPGDSESFGEGVRLTDLLGLKELGIWYDRISPGHRSSFPHAHTHEEEFGYIMSGSPELWLNGELFPVKPKQAFGFLPNTAKAHCLINSSTEVVELLSVGETKEFVDEKIFYPCNPLRNKECERKNWLWMNPAIENMGQASPFPKNFLKDVIQFSICSELQTEEVLNIFKASPDYFTKVEGQPPSLATARIAIVDKPKTLCESYYKEFLLVHFNGQAIGAIDIHLNHPEAGIAYIGLLLLKDSFKNQGLGRKSYQLLEDYLKRAHDMKLIRIGISDANEVSGFWSQLGFAENARVYQWQGEQKTTQIKEFQKTI